MLPKIQYLSNPVAIQRNIKDTSDLYLHWKFDTSEVPEKMPTKYNQVARRGDHPTACSMLQPHLKDSTIYKGWGDPRTCSEKGNTAGVRAGRNTLWAAGGYTRLFCFGGKEAEGQLHCALGWGGWALLPGILQQHVWEWFKAVKG